MDTIGNKGNKVMAPVYKPGQAPVTPDVSSGLPSWLYQGPDGQWYSDYDPAAPGRPGATPKQTLQSAQDPVIPKAPMPVLGLIKGPQMGAPREDARQDRRRFRTSPSSGLGLIQ